METTGSESVMDFEYLQTFLISHLENEAVAEFRIRARAPGLGLSWPPVIREKPQLHQGNVAVKAWGEVTQAEQRDHELLSTVSVLHREAQAGGHAGRRSDHLLQGRRRVQAGVDRSHWIPAWRSCRSTQIQMIICRYLGRLF